MAEPLLALRGLGEHFGGVQAVKVLSFSMGAAKIDRLIGANGSGRSTSTAGAMFRPRRPEPRFLPPAWPAGTWQR